MMKTQLSIFLLSLLSLSCVETSNKTGQWTVEPVKDEFGDIIEGQNFVLGTFNGNFRSSLIGNGELKSLIRVEESFIAITLYDQVQSYQLDLPNGLVTMKIKLANGEIIELQPATMDNIIIDSRGVLYNLLAEEIEPMKVLLDYSTNEYSGGLICNFEINPTGFNDLAPPFVPSEQELNRKKAEEYEKIRAEEAKRIEASISELQYVNDGQINERGHSLFQQQCAVCHREDGGGSIGPNLTDQYWIHGSSFPEIYVTIRDGVPAKGCISWKDLLTADQIRDVANYIVSIEGSNPVGGKKPQGVKSK